MPLDAVKTRLAYGSFVSLRYRYVYVETPKVACSTIKSVIHAVEELPPIRICDATFYETRRDMAIHVRHRFALPSLMSLPTKQAAEILSDPSFFKFSFVRNPYSRLYSAWKDKVRLVQPGYEGVAKRIAHQCGREENTVSVEFSDFIKFIGNENPRTCDHKTCDPHWSLQCSMLLTSAIPYNLIGRFENFSDDFSKFLCHLKRNGADLDPDTIPWQNASRGGRWREAFTEADARCAFLFAREDFEAFGYPQDSWQSETGPATVDAQEEVRRLEREIYERNRVIADLYNEVWALRRELARRPAAVTE